MLTDVSPATSAATKPVPARFASYLHYVRLVSVGDVFENKNKKEKFESAALADSSGAHGSVNVSLRPMTQ